MPDSVTRYYRKHKATVAVVIAIFTAGGMFAVARADMDAIKASNKAHESRLGALEKESNLSHSKLDGIAEDVIIIKRVLIGGN